MAFDLSAWSKFVLWFVALSSLGFVALLLFIFVASVRGWNDIDVRVLFAIPTLLLAYFGVGQLRYLFIESPLLTIGPAGIEDKLSGFGFIPWEDVTGALASVQSIRGGVYKTLYLKVRNADIYYARVSWLVRPFVPLRWFRKDSLGINFSYLNGTMEEALECIHSFRPFVPIEEISK
jgi:hypothetical protein